MERKIPGKFTNEELLMAALFSKNRAIFAPEITKRLIYALIVTSAEAGVALQKGAGKLVPKL